MAKKQLFNDGWQFCKTRMGITKEQALTMPFAPVDIPHDWLIYDTGNLYEDSQGWYRKEFTLDKKQGVSYGIYFEGVYMDSEVYVNDCFVGEWKYGYTSFEHRITDALVEGYNHILVHVRHQNPNSRWYSGAGIYRKVWLVEYPEVHFLSQGLYVSTSRVEDDWVLTVDAEVAGFGEAPLPLLSIRHLLRTMDQQPIAQKQQPLQSEWNLDVVSMQLTIAGDSVKPWDLESPQLYELVSEIVVDGLVVDAEITKIGFRTIRMSPDEGFFLNEKPLKLHGVCMHHDLGCLGSAVNRRAIERQFHKMKEMGANAIRTAHNIPAKEYMELADEMGLFIVSEAFDMWELSKTEYDYARFFKQWVSKDVSSWVRRDRNHPSLIMWSIGNEIYDTHAGEQGYEITKRLLAFVTEHDPRQNGYVTFGSNYLLGESTQKCADLLRIVGYNYAEKYYDEHHAKYPDWVIYGSETASTLQSRGIYHFPLSQKILTDEDEQCSSLGNTTTSWGAKSTDACLVADANCEYSMGQFIWTGFDYIGEPTPYRTKNAYYGQVDTAGFEKDSFYLYQAAWTSAQKRPMVHIYPYWDFNPGEPIDVRVCSNAARVELLVGGVSQGVKELTGNPRETFVADWCIPYQEGMIEARAYNETGELVASKERHSFSDAKKIIMIPDRKEIKATGEDVVFVTISVTDEEGYLVENANQKIRIQLEGEGRLLGLDNGDSTDYESYQCNERNMFSGKLLAVVASTKKAGTITIHATGQGLIASEVSIVVSEVSAEEAKSNPYLAQEYLQGISAQECVKNTRKTIDMGIVVRKITLDAGGMTTLTEKQPSVKVIALRHPLTATPYPLEWQVVNDAGIATNIATLDVHDEFVHVKALGDGHFRLRCLCRNGRKIAPIISQMSFTVTGLGTAYKDPYQFIAGGLHDYVTGNITDGNEKGFATDRDAETCVGFQNMDFGKDGSKQVTIPIFAFSGDEYAFSLWKGIPGEEGSEKILDTVYQKPCIWDVYQPETYTLSCRLTGVQTICFVTSQMMHVKGLLFHPYQRAFQRLYSLENDCIYGDSYRYTKDAIEEIGNNVMIQFQDLDFMEEEVTAITICGRTMHAQDTIHLVMESEQGTLREQIEFHQTKEYQEETFPIATVQGVNHIGLLFLPGSKFDLQWIQFRTARDLEKAKGDKERSAKAQNKAFTTVAICLAKYYAEDQQNFIRSFCSKCEDHQTKVVIFSTETDLFFGDNIDMGEEKIFSLLDPDQFDAVIVLSETFTQSDLPERLVKKVQKAGVPIVSINREIPGAINILYQFGDAFEKIVRHMVEDHKLTRVNFIAGMKNNRFSQERLDCYKKVLQENGIPYEPERVGYGDFWDQPTYPVVDKFMKSSLPRPEAILCANDMMAIATCEKLEEYGYRVPEDMLVSGFDGIELEKYHYPRLTTAEFDLKKLIDTLHQILQQIVSGKPYEENYTIAYKYRLGMSCGCRKIRPNEAGKRLLMDKRSRDYENDYYQRLSNMMSHLGNAGSISSIAAQVDTYCRDMGGRGYWICVNEEFVDETREYSGLYGGSFSKGRAYSEHMQVIYQDYPKRERDAGRILTAQLLPDYPEILCQEDVIMFVPMHLQGETIGYMATSFSADDFQFTFYKYFHNNFQYVLELYKKRVDMERLYIHDVLTGLYNRHGFYRNIEEYMQTCIRYQKPFSLISIDMNGLKIINDVYGHMEGDYALKKFADCLRKSILPAEICCRFGGDEFLIALPSVHESERAKEIVESIRNYVERVNKTSEKPYQISASYGIYEEIPKTNSTLDEFIRRADEYMYENKSYLKEQMKKEVIRD